MKIHIYDTDPRFHSDPNYLKTMGSFGVVAHGFNSGLKEIGAYSEAPDCDWFGICDGLNLGFDYLDKKTFSLHVWDCINSLPTALINIQKNTNQKIVGLSSQVSSLWNKYGIDAKYVMPGCDTNFWHQTKPKNENITFLFNSFGNVRSGLDLALQAFYTAFNGRKDVKLIVKNINSSNKLKQVISKYSCNANIELIDGRMTTDEMRDLYSVSHFTLNVMRHSSWGLNVHEAAACGCIPILGDFYPSCSMLSKDSALFLQPSGEVEIPEIVPYLVNEFGLHNAYGNLSYDEVPRIYEYSIDGYALLLRNAALMTKDSFKLIDPRKEVVQNWTWAKAAENLIKALE